MEGNKRMNMIFFYGAVLVLVLLCIVVKTSHVSEPHIVFSGYERREGWLIARAMYAYRCPGCGGLTTSPNHGRRDKLRVTCDLCGETTRFGEHSVLRRLHDE